MLDRPSTATGDHRRLSAVVGPPPDDRSDAELLAATPRSPASFAVFYRRHVRGVLRYHYRRTRDVEVAADLTAETFAAALYSVRGFDPARGTPSQWLYGIARHQLLAFWRRNRVSDRLRRKLQIEAIEVDLVQADELERAEAIADGGPVMDAVDRLPAPLRAAVRLRLIEGRDYASIAGDLGCSTGAARLRVFRALKRLQEDLDA